MSDTTASRALPQRKRIFIVEDHPVFREGLVQIVGREADVEVCGYAGTVAQALEAIARLQPDLVLVDITLPGKSGLELIKTVRAADRRIKLLVVSMHDEALYANRVLRMGGDGYIMKQEDPGEIIHAIRDVLAGHIYVSEEVMASSVKPAQAAPSNAKGRLLDKLTDAELEILELLGKGKTNREIARELQLKLTEVPRQCTVIRKKLKLRSDNALIRYAVCWAENGSD